jgi:hypothetical protein
MDFELEVGASAVEFIAVEETDQTDSVILNLRDALSDDAVES